ncbi:Hydroxyethylthiazole kinase family-domain-containing protein [Gilbertella persicaria]|uniref:Hydroxyethylthiazole kinase family-domain-containing protein n=1 Tax=Gilbertella persicaria TaxID=101096 RepID=UPI00221EA31B|nr:Hydroxyethylthiazole kinase family-domain-containing protein [Gilbertella persicaria]KAI8077244.1 Hydroxyethylthiazole kinase family-domain-containing protein [Gilbertella persicaria]
MAIKKVDYSLYLVTDRSLVPEGKTFLGQIERALEGGVTIVQLREKDTETGPFIDFALKVKALTRKYGVPLIINDRLDVAQAVDAEGVHIGQDDMPLTQARHILGPKKIIGVSCNTEQEAVTAIRDGADYLGIGAVWFTSTKKNIKQPLGVEGVQRILRSIEANPIPTVAIGGISAKNACELLEGSHTGKMYTDGLAIVSAIMAAQDPKLACEELLGLIRHSFEKMGVKANTTVDDAVTYAIQAAKNIKAKTPMVHHITNYVVINDNANATLAVGASPIMSTNAQELRDLAAVNGAMLLNMGTLNDIDFMISAAQVNASHKNPVILDPVGCGATQFRKQTLTRFLNECDLTVIKGNAGEILSMSGFGGKSRGVDSVGTHEEQVMVSAVKQLARENNCVIGLTGPVDYVSDGHRVFAIENGDPYLPLITGSGCMVSSVVACFTAANRDDYLLATVAGILTVTVASELAAKREYVHGPGTFRAALIDELYNVTNSPELLQKYARIRVIQ